MTSLRGLSRDDREINVSFHHKRASLMPPSNLPRVLLHDNCSQQHLLDLRLHQITEQQLRKQRTLEWRRRTFLTEQALKQEQLTERGVCHVTLVPTAVARAYSKLTRFYKHTVKRLPPAVHIRREERLEYGAAGSRGDAAGSGLGTGGGSGTGSGSVVSKWRVAGRSGSGDGLEGGCGGIDGGSGGGGGERGGEGGGGDGVGGEGSGGGGIARKGGEGEGKGDGGSGDGGGGEVGGGEAHTGDGGREGHGRSGKGGTDGEAGGEAGRGGGVRGREGGREGGGGCKDGGAGGGGDRGGRGGGGAAEGREGGRGIGDTATNIHGWTPAIRLLSPRIRNQRRGFPTIRVTSCDCVDGDRPPRESETAQGSGQSAGFRTPTEGDTRIPRASGTIITHARTPRMKLGAWRATRHKQRNTCLQSLQIRGGVSSQASESHSNAGLRPSKYCDAIFQASKDSNATLQPLKDINASLQPSKDSNIYRRPLKDSSISLQPSTDIYSNLQPLKCREASLQPSEDSNTSLQPLKDVNTIWQPSKDSNATLQPSKDINTSFQSSKNINPNLQPSKDSNASLQPVQMPSSANLQPSKDGNATLQSSHAMNSAHLLTSQHRRHLLLKQTLPMSRQLLLRDPRFVDLQKHLVAPPDDSPAALDFGGLWALASVSSALQGDAKSFGALAPEKVAPTKANANRIQSVFQPDMSDSMMSPYFSSDSESSGDEDGEVGLS